MATVLIVDDDPLQASLMMSLLGRGFGDVRRAKDAAGAFCLIEQPGFSCDLGLVISGHHTPGIGGPAFVKELHQRMPKLPVLVIGSIHDQPADYLDDHVVYLPRPSIGDQMLTLANQLLAQRKSAAA